MTEFNYSQASNTPLVMCKVYLRLHWLFTSFSSRVARKPLSISTPAVPMTISIVFVIFMWSLAWKTLSITFHASIWLPAWPSSRCMATGRKQNSPFSALTRFCYLKSFISEIPELSFLGGWCKERLILFRKGRIWIQNFYTCTPSLLKTK